MGVGHYENFPVASLLLPAPLREPVEVIYRFARSADDFADEGHDEPEIRLRKLDDYRRQLLRPIDPVLRDVAKVIREHDLPVGLFADLLDAFSQDVTKKRYADFSDLQQERFGRRGELPAVVVQPLQASLGRVAALVGEVVSIAREAVDDFDRRAQCCGKEERRNREIFVMADRHPRESS